MRRSSSSFDGIVRKLATQMHALEESLPSNRAPIIISPCRLLAEMCICVVHQAKLRKEDGCADNGKLPQGEKQDPSRPRVTAQMEQKQFLLSEQAQKYHQMRNFCTRSRSLSYQPPLRFVGIWSKVLGKLKTLSLRRPRLLSGS